MARTRELKVVIAGDADKLDKAVRKGGAGLNKLGAEWTKAAQVAKRADAAAADSAVARVRKIDAALEKEIAALRKSGASWEKVARVMRESGRDATQTAAAIQRASGKGERSLDKFGKQTRLTGTISSKGFAAMRVGAVGATAAIGGLALAGKKVVEAAIESEKSQARLASQLKASGISYKAHAKDIEAVIQKHSQLAGVDDEELQDAFTAIVRTTGSVTTAMQSMGLVTDLARSKNMDVAKAGDAVAKVHAGQYRALKTLNLEFVKTTANVDRLKASDDKITPAELAAAKAADVRANATRALGLVQDKVRGQAEAYGNTTAGAVDRAKVSFENLEETVGAAVAPTVEKAANEVADFVNEMQSGTGQGGKFVDTLKDIWGEVKPVVTWVGRATKNVAEFVKEHPNVGKLALAIIGVGAAVKTLKFVSAATGFTDLLKAGGVAARGLRRVLTRSAAAAGEDAAASAASGFATKRGLLSRAASSASNSVKRILGRGGTAAGEAAAAGAAGGMTGRSAAIGGAASKAGKTAGRKFAAGFILGIPLLILEFKDEINKAGEWFSGTTIGKILTSPMKLGDKIGDLIGGILGRNAGGIVPGRGDTDAVPAMLTPGEFVIRKSVVEKYGPTFFAGLNGGWGEAGPHFAKGGPVKHNATYYRNRFGDRYRGFYLWGTYGEGKDRFAHTHNPGIGVFNGIVDDYYDGKLPQHAGLDAWYNKWKTGRRFAKGGPVKHFTSGGIVARANKIDGGGHVKHNATYYRNRFGDRYRGFYLWATYGQGKGLPRNPGSGEWYGALNAYAGDWRNVDDARAWRMKWARAQRFTSGGIVARANKIDGMRIPYLYGGGHGTRDGFNKSGMDCSASVSYALGVSPRVSGQFMGFGLPGPGSPNDTKVYANPGHMFAVFNGRGWGTSRENPGGGPGWLSYNHRSGFTIRHLEDGGEKGSGAVEGDPQESVESGKSTRTERQQRAGSRIVNAIAGRTLRGASRDTRRAAAIGTVIEDAESGYGRSERFFGQVRGGRPGDFGDEDLGTSQGRADRISEIGELRKLKTQQLARLRKRAAALKRVIVKYEKALRQMSKARGKAKGAKRAKISERMRAYDDRLTDWKAELRALGGQIADTTLDLSDLVKEAGEIAGTPDTEQPEQSSPTDKLGETLSDIDLQERAGLLTAAQARDARIATLNAALGGQFGALSDRERWQVMGDLREAMDQAAQAVVDNTSALRDLKASIDAQNAIATSSVGIQLREATRALGDLISGELGQRVVRRGFVPGDGSLSRL